MGDAAGSDEEREPNAENADGETDGARESAEDADGDGEPDAGDGEPAEASTGGPTSSAQRQREVVTRDELRDLQEKLDEFEEEIEDRTVHRAELEGDLKQYVRSRLRRGHATGWGPYLVLLYGTVMTLGAFYFLGGGWAILAMLVVWLSTLGLYTLMILVGITATAVGLPGRALDRVRSLR